MQFHFHALSEHTIDGVRFDLEMHSVHLPDNKQDGYFAAVQGLIFDTQRYDQSITKEEIAIVDEFFDSLKWDSLDVNSKGGSATLEVNLNSVNYGQLMNLASTNNRYVYTGSLTTPPCTEKVYWNVINRIYPIKARHLE